MKKIKIMIVEDDPDTEIFFKLFLGKNFFLKIYNSDETAVDDVMNNKFDIIIIDVSIKKKENGIRIVRELKSPGIQNGIPIIYLSSHVIKGENHWVNQKDVDVFLEKPVSNETLLEHILDLTDAMSN